MSIWSILWNVLDSDFGYDLGVACRKAILEGMNRRRSCDDDDVAAAPAKETPEEAFEKMIRDNAAQFDADSNPENFGPAE
jgi:hypothetical protein